MLAKRVWKGLVIYDLTLFFLDKYINMSLERKIELIMLNRVRYIICLLLIYHLYIIEIYFSEIWYVAKNIDQKVIKDLKEF